MKTLNQHKIMIEEKNTNEQQNPAFFVGAVNSSDWIQVLSGHEITKYSKTLNPIWVILEDDENKKAILAQPDGNDNYYGEDGIVYHYCDIAYFMKIIRPVFQH